MTSLGLAWLAIIGLATALRAAPDIGSFDRSGHERRAPVKVALPKGSGSAQASAPSKMNGLPAPVSIPEATFAAVSTAISFAGLAALVFEFTCATQAGTVATGLCLFDQVLRRQNLTNAICWRCPGSRDKKTEAHCCGGSND